MSATLARRVRRSLAALGSFPHPDDRERSRSGCDCGVESALERLDEPMFDEAAVSSARAPRNRSSEIDNLSSHTADGVRTSPRHRCPLALPARSEQTLRERARARRVRQTRGCGSTSRMSDHCTAKHGAELRRKRSLRPIGARGADTRARRCARTHALAPAQALPEPLARPARPEFAPACRPDLCAELAQLLARPARPEIAPIRRQSQRPNSRRPREHANLRA